MIGILKQKKMRSCLVGENHPSQQKKAISLPISTDEERTVSTISITTDVFAVDLKHSTISSETK